MAISVESYMLHYVSFCEKLGYVNAFFYMVVWTRKIDYNTEKHLSGNQLSKKPLRNKERLFCESVISEKNVKVVARMGRGE
jgi:hypothetical protein